MTADDRNAISEEDLRDAFEAWWRSRHEAVQRATTAGILKEGLKQFAWEAFKVGHSVRKP